jgi:hypothetical protein
MNEANKQTALENVTAGGDIDATISQEIHNEPSKLADKIGVVAQAGSVVNIATLNVGDAKINPQGDRAKIGKQINVNQSGNNNTQNNTFNL